jgi:hypothetical protein
MALGFGRGFSYVHHTSFSECRLMARHRFLHRSILTPGGYASLAAMSFSHSASGAAADDHGLCLSVSLGEYDVGCRRTVPVNREFVERDVIHDELTD